MTMRGTCLMKFSLLVLTSGSVTNLIGILSPHWTSLRLQAPLLGNKSYHFGLFSADDVMKDLEHLLTSAEKFDHSGGLKDLIGLLGNRKNNKKHGKNKHKSNLLNSLHPHNKDETRGNSSDHSSQIINKLYHILLGKNVTSLTNQNVTSVTPNNSSGIVHLINDHVVSTGNETKRRDDLNSSLPVVPRSRRSLHLKGLQIHVDCVSKSVEGATIEYYKVVLKDLPDVFKKTIIFSLAGEILSLMSIVLLSVYMICVKSGKYVIYWTSFLFIILAGGSTFTALFVYFSQVPGCLSWSFNLCASSVLLYFVTNVFLLINGVVSNGKGDNCKNPRAYVRYSRLLGYS